MYLSDLVEDVINAKLRASCIDKLITIPDDNPSGYITFICKSVTFSTDDGGTRLEFIDNYGKSFITESESIKIWFELEEL